MKNMKKPAIAKMGIGEAACFNGVGGSGKESEYMSLMAPTMARVVKETNLIEFMRPQIEKLSAGDEVACFNGVGGSGKEMASLVSLPERKK